MKGMFWNSNGLGDLNKPRFLFDSMIEHQLDFIALFIFVLTKTLFGIGLYQMVGQEGS
jgi:hypothetical protein